MANKTWLVTGTHTGFGKELATLLAQQDNVNLVATARHPEKQLDYLDQYDHGQIKKAQLDVTDRDEINTTVKTAKDAFGSIDVLVNNAGLGYFGTFEESDRDEVRYMFDVNVWGLVDMTRSVLPTMRKQKSGTIINFSSVAGLVSSPGVSFYNGTKHAVEGLSKSLAQEVKPSGLKVMLVEPGPFRTDWAGRSSEKTLTKIDDYKPVSEGIEQFGKNAHHEAGDPKRAAEIIYDQVENHYDELPLHLPLGKAATDGATSTYKDDLKQFEKLHDLSISADRKE